ncbi:sulfotransferase family cytosolic 1B member 1-like isoform X3 [Trichoplusia ni]|uniref:Sulfotransferase family cytosolic 1B member 1-like isoform X3 n=1 Tax=Trichoplusia ni TaxID=7111 RepID=A0A7E5V8U5_TRINI|nr:sulfotransferase family cytosolic 1B member 1-like isoform X3 [Trichoplusia ni]
MGKGELNFPFEYEELKPEERHEIQKLFKCPYVDYISVGPKKYKIQRRYLEEAANIYNMPLRKDDIFVLTYQRSGTTWTQELVWLLANDLNYETARAIPLLHRYPFLDIFFFFSKDWKDYCRKNISDDETALKILEQIATPVTNLLLSTPSPRMIKSHLPLSLLPPTLLDNGKVVYVARDPRDVAVSSYHHSRLFKVLDFSGTFKEFWNLFIRDLFTLTPYFEHVKEAWEKRNHPNMLFLFYENLSKDMPSVVRRVADFLGKDPSPEEMSRLRDHLSFENFRKNESVNMEDLKDCGLLAKDEKFIRKGKSGGWRDYFDEEMTQQAEKWIADNLRDTDLRFPTM